MQVGTRSLGWYQQQSAWDQMQARRERSAMNFEKFEQQRTLLNDGLTAAFSNQSAALGELAAQAALKRIQKEAVALAERRRQEAADQATRELIWRKPPVAPPAEVAGVSPKLSDGMLTLADGTKLDLKTGRPAGNFMLLADGSKINLDTGKKVVDVKV